MPITSYPYEMFPGFEGQISHLQQTRTDLRGTANEVIAAAELRFGRFVSAQGGNRGLLVPANSTDLIVGVTYYTARHEKKADGTAFIPQDAIAGYMVEGIIFMVSETAIAANANPFVRVTDNVVPAAFEARGRIRSDADTGNAVAATYARTLKAASQAGQIIPVEIRMPL